MVARTLTVEQIAALRLPTRYEMQTVAAALPQVERGVWRGYAERPGTFLEVAPGMLRVFRSRIHPEVARDHARWLAQESALSERILTEKLDEARYREVMALLSDGDVNALRKPRRPSSGKIVGWSRRSRARMQMQLNRLDYTPLFEAGLEPAMVTLTLPGEWEHLVPTPEAFKRMVNHFTASYRNAWHAPIRAVWKMEFQRRGAPHLHILMTPPAGVADSIDPFEFREWLSRTWARIVGAEGEERRRHERAGTGIDYVGDAYRDPRRIAAYFGKHGFFEAKDYQNEMPALWRDAIAQGERGARFWGVWGLEKASAVLQLDDRAEVALSGFVADIETREEVTEKSIIGDLAEELENGEIWATDASVLRARQRALDAFGSESSDVAKVERHMRKLSRSLAMRGQQLVRNRHGQLVLPDDSKVVRKITYDAADERTGEIRRLSRYRIGYYHGNSGFLLVHDGAAAARDIQRILDRRDSWQQAA